MTSVVVDSSAVVAALTDDGPVGTWVREQMSGAALTAPHLMPFEAANVLRRAEIAGVLGADSAALAHADLVDLPVALWPYDDLAGAAWWLRHNVTVPDASYVVLSGVLGAPLLTLDRRLARAPGVRCDVILPP